MRDDFFYQQNKSPSFSALLILKIGVYSAALMSSSATSTAIIARALSSSLEAELASLWLALRTSLAAALSISVTEQASSANTCTEESSLMVTVPELTKIFLEVPSFSKTVTTPGLSTAREGTWLGRIPKLPENDGTSTCFTSAAL